MKRPGLTVGSSLYQSHEPYQFGVTHAAQADTNEIVPQQACFFDQYAGEATAVVGAFGSAILCRLLSLVNQGGLVSRDISD